MPQKFIRTSLSSREILLRIHKDSLPSKLLEVEIPQNDKRIKAFLRYQLTAEHLAKSLEFVNAYKKLGDSKTVNKKLDEYEEKNSTIKFALTIGAIMMYYKPFTTTKGPLSHKPLKPNLCYKNRPTLEKFHSKISLMRNQFIAHSGDSEYEAIAAFLTFEQLPNPWLHAEHVYHLGFDLDEINLFEKMIKHLISFIEIKTIKYRNEFFELINMGGESKIYLKRAIKSYNKRNSKS